MKSAKSISLGQACLDLALELEKQPELFEPALLPFETDLIQAGKALAFTGTITCRDEARAAAIGACKVAGLSDSETARRVGCSRNTIGPVIEHLERSGRLPGIQARLSSKLGAVAEASADALQELIAANHWTADRAGAVRALGVTLGIATEKHLLLTGQATAIIEQRAAEPSADAIATWEAKLRRLAEMISAPSDGSSEGIQRTPLEISLPPGTATTVATSGLPDPALLDPSVPSTLADPLPQLPLCRGAGGGFTAAAPAATATPSSE